MVMENKTEMTNEQIYSLLSHPDGMVRSLADWTREYRGYGTRWQVIPNEGVAEDYEARLVERLNELEATA